MGCGEAGGDVTVVDVNHDRRLVPMNMHLLQRCSISAPAESNARMRAPDDRDQREALLLRLIGAPPSCRARR